MPKYFFHLEHGDFSPDQDGVELANVDHARVEAVRVSGELLRDAAEAFWPKGQDWHLRVMDDSGQLLFSLRFSADEPSGKVPFQPV